MNHDGIVVGDSLFLPNGLEDLGFGKDAGGIG